MLKRKILILAAIIFFCLPLATVFAQTDTNTDSIAKAKEAADTTLIADVNIFNSRIDAQVGHQLKVSFDISNNMGVQAGIKYGIELIAHKDGKTFQADYFVYDEELTLNEDASVSREVEYNAPKFLDGTYELWLRSFNKNGVPFALVHVSDIDLEAETDYVALDTPECYLTVSREKTRYGISEGVDIKPSDTLFLHCQSENKYKYDLAILRANIMIFKRSVYGELVTERTQNIVNFSLATGDKKMMEVKIPLENLPAQSYDVAFSLMNKKGIKISNKLIFHIVITGESATIQNVNIDKDYYKSGEKALVNLFWTSSADIFPYSRNSGTKLANVEIKVDIYDKDNEACSDQFTETVEENDNIKKFVIPITSDCQDPRVKTVILNDEKLEMDSHEFSLTSVIPEKSTQTAPIVNESLKNIWSLDESLIPAIIFLLLILAVVLITAGWIMFHIKKNRAEEDKVKHIKNKIFIFLLSAVIGVGSFFGVRVESVAAATFVSSGWTNDGENYIVEIFAVNRDKASYNPGDDMQIFTTAMNGNCSSGLGNLNISFEEKSFVEYTWCNSEYEKTGKVCDKDWWKNRWSTAMPFFVNTTAGNTPGTYVLELRSSSVGISGVYKINYSVDSAECTCNTCVDCTEKLNSNKCNIIKLTADLSNVSGVCIDDPKITYKTFDCQNHQISGIDTGHGSALALTAPNSAYIIKNCKISKFAYGIRLDNGNAPGHSESYILDNNKIDNCGIGIFLDKAKAASVKNNNISATIFSGIYARDVQNSVFDKNEINNNNFQGLVFFSSGKTVSEGLTQSFGNTVKNCNIQSNNIGLVFKAGSDKNKVLDNNLCYNAAADIYNNSSGAEVNNGDGNSGSEGKISGLADWFDKSAVNGRHFSANCIPTIIASCGPLNGIPAADMPADPGLCTLGEPSKVAKDEEEWHWTCIGAGSKGVNADCVAPTNVCGDNILNQDWEECELNENGFEQRDPEGTCVDCFDCLCDKHLPEW